MDPILPDGAPSCAPLDPVRVEGDVEALAQERDQVGHLVDVEAERRRADVVAPQRQHYDLGVLVPGDLQAATRTTGVAEQRSQLSRHAA